MMEPRNGTTKENREAKRNLHRADPNEEREKYLSGPPPTQYEVTKDTRN